MNKISKLLILISLLFLGNEISAQTYPVQATVQLTPPYSLFLSDYANDKMFVNLFLNDNNQDGLQVKLKITITSSNGVKLITKSDFVPLPITLNSNLPIQISGPELEPYLNPANMTIEGLNVSQFLNTKKLPEGIYQFTVQAIEYRRDKLVSNAGMTVGWLLLNEPPIWNLPFNNSTITASVPQNILFSWTPMHTGSPNSAFTTEYEFSLYEIIPQTRNPNDAVNTGNPIYQTTTMMNRLIIGPDATQLEIGKKYACRIKAYDVLGRDMFKNNGYSTVLTFINGKDCQTPIGINSQVDEPFNAKVSWMPIPGNTEFQIAYREKTQDNNAQWYYKNTYNTNFDINQLKPEHTYEYKVKGICGSLESNFSDNYQFTTPPKPPADTTACDGNGNVPDIDDSPPLENLYLGDIINIGGFEGVITRASGSNGVFTGNCFMRVTNFNLLLKSHFTNIHINQSYQVTEGQVIVDRGPGIMINMDKVIATIDSLANILIDSIIHKPDDYIASLDSVLYDVDPSNVSDSLKENLRTVLTNLQIVGTSDSLSEADKMQLNQEKQQIYNLLNNNSTLEDNPSFVMFHASPNQKYGFDEPDMSLEALLKYYTPTNEIQGKNQLRRWKSVKFGQTDYVYAILDSVASNVKFFDQNNTELTPQTGSNDTLKILMINGQTPDVPQYIIAKQKINDTTETIVGKLDIVCYSEIKNNLHIIPVNSNSLPAGMNITTFTDSINKVFYQGVGSWNVDILQGVQFDYSIADSNSTFDAYPPNQVRYTPDMQALINKYKENHSFNELDYYIFLVDKPEYIVEVGIMPFNQNKAFIYVDQIESQTTFIKVAGHELGHGTYGLEHPFQNNPEIDEYRTKNLMSHNPVSTFLSQYQWQQMQHPVCSIDGSCASAENEMMTAPNTLAVMQQIQAIRYAYTFNVPLKVTIPNVVTSYFDEPEIVGFLDRFKPFFKGGNCGIASLNKSIKNEAIVIDRSVDWDRATWNNGLKFKTSSNNTFRLYINYPTQSTDLYSWFKAYLFSTSHTKWKEDFANVLKEKDKELLKYKLATYPYSVYKEIDFEDANKFLNVIIETNYTPSYDPWGNIFQSGNYKDYMCAVTKYLLKKYYNKTCSDCDDFDKYETLTKLVGQESDYNVIVNSVFNGMEKGDETELVITTFSNQLGASDCLDHCRILAKQSNSNYIFHLFDKVKEVPVKENLSLVNTSTHVEKDIKYNTNNGFHRTLTKTREVVNFNKDTLFKGINKINENLKNDIPTIVGVSYGAKCSPYNPGKTADHFIIIVAKGIDENGLYFRFFDVASSSGNNEDNRLYLNEDLIISNKKYLLVELRLVGNSKINENIQVNTSELNMNKSCNECECTQDNANKKYCKDSCFK